MKRILVKLIAGCAGFLVVIAICLILSLFSPFKEFFSWATLSEEYNRAPSEEIIPLIEAARSDSEHTKLIVGDSVCRQVFNPMQEYNDVYAIIGSNQAVTIIGQYLMAEEFVKSHENVTDIYLVTTRLTGTGLKFRGMAYQYLVIPFTETEILQNADAEIRNEIADRFGEFWVNPVTVERIDYSPLIKRIYLNSLNDDAYDNRGMALRYLEKFITLCETNGIEFHLIYGPICEVEKEKMQRERDMLLKVCQNDKVKEKINEFYDTVIFYPEDVFSDGSHFKEEYETEERLSEIINRMQDESGVLLDFVTAY